MRFRLSPLQLSVQTPFLKTHQHSNTAPVLAPRRPEQF